VRGVKYTYFFVTRHAVSNNTTQSHYSVIGFSLRDAEIWCPLRAGYIHACCRLYVCPVPISAVILASNPSERIGISGLWNGFFITASA